MKRKPKNQNILFQTEPHDLIAIFNLDIEQAVEWAKELAEWIERDGDTSLVVDGDVSDFPEVLTENHKFKPK